MFPDTDKARVWNKHTDIIVTSGRTVTDCNSAVLLKHTTDQFCRIDTWSIFKAIDLLEHIQNNCKNFNIQNNFQGICFKKFEQKYQWTPDARWLGYKFGNQVPTGQTKILKTHSPKTKLPSEQFPGNTIAYLVCIPRSATTKLSSVTSYVMKWIVWVHHTTQERMEIWKKWRRERVVKGMHQTGRHKYEELPKLFQSFGHKKLVSPFHINIIVNEEQVCDDGEEEANGRDKRIERLGNCFRASQYFILVCQPSVQWCSSQGRELGIYMFVTWSQIYTK